MGPRGVSHPQILEQRAYGAEAAKTRGINSLEWHSRSVLRLSCQPMTIFFIFFFLLLIFKFSVKIVNTPITWLSEQSRLRDVVIAQRLPLPSRPSCSFSHPCSKIEHPNVTSNGRHSNGHGLCYWPAAKNCCTGNIIFLFFFYFFRRCQPWGKLTR